MNEEKPVSINPCHAGYDIALEPVWLMVPRAAPYEGTTGRKHIGNVRVCMGMKGRDRCDKILGGLRRIQGTPNDFREEQWLRMLKHHPNPPHYFEQREGGYFPEGYTK